MSLLDMERWLLQVKHQGKDGMSWDSQVVTSATRTLMTKNLAPSLVDSTMGSAQRIWKQGCLVMYFRRILWRSVGDLAEGELIPVGRPWKLAAITYTWGDTVLVPHWPCFLSWSVWHFIRWSGIPVSGGEMYEMQFDGRKKKGKGEGLRED